MGKGDEYKDTFNLYDDDCEGKVDAQDIGTVSRALGLKITNEMVWKAIGLEPKKRGEKKFTLEEFADVHGKLKNEKMDATFADYLEALKVFDKEETGKILAGEVKSVLMSLGEKLQKPQIEEVMEGIVEKDGMLDYSKSKISTEVLKCPHKISKVTTCRHRYSKITQDKSDKVPC